ncbi:hypothetical protein HRI_002159100 [Hibiscus trionum]|uniref:Reverse transcriptase Ty1/copia-type domain-containing protein n=1 Tax=Hibiscus trionum TaxID=183268 RepID=A0A9W7HWU9_HIBTR|nr:hypothetical protein HRI_002159100 [Hibiscus trionum]
MTATYLINRLPSPLLDAKSLFELLHNRLPDYNFLRVFGSLCFVSTLRAHRDKFSERALPGVFIGYAPGMKKYKIYVLKSHSIVTSRDVVFHEGVYHFHTITNSEAIIDPFPDICLPSGVSTNIPDRSTQFDAFRISPRVQGTEVVVEIDVHAEPVVETAINPVLEPVIEPIIEDDSIIDSEPMLEATSLDDPIIVPGQHLDPEPRRSIRVAKKPSYLHQYYCNIASSCSYPIENHLVSSSVSSSYAAFLANLSSTIEPSFYHQAVKFPEWRSAMQDELRAMENLHTWTVVSLPLGKQPIDCKWVYKMKYNYDGTIDIYKARLVAKGIDYTDTFSSGARMTSFKVLLSLAAVHDWHLLQLDVNNAFLNG